MFALLTPPPPLAVIDGADWLFLLGALIGGGIVGVLGLALLTGRTVKSAAREAETRRREARAEAEAEAGRIQLEAEKRAAERREAFDREVTEALADIKKNQDRAARREDALDARFEQIERRESKLEERDRVSEMRRAEVDALHDEARSKRDDLVARLEAASSMSTEDARNEILAEVREATANEATTLRKEILETAEAEARGQAREITLMAIQRYAAENVADSTVRSVKIPSDDMKGRIIGREGRNIRTIERATGADILVDDTPGIISVSCFDRVRQAIAAEALQKLVADGRVHPSRIEELVAQTKRDIEERIQTYGKEAVVEANIRGLHPKIIEAMGKMHFRTSYGQNVLRHSIEVAFLSQMIAEALDLDGQVARRAGFLHDIGKAMDHEMEGGHPAIGMEFARKYGEKQDAVLNAIGGHHGDIPATTPYTPIVMAADAHLRRPPRGPSRVDGDVRQAPRAARGDRVASQDGWSTEAHAIQAGREVRVIVDTPARSTTPRRRSPSRKSHRRSAWRRR